MVNKNIAENFLSFDKDYNDNIYYGELGMAHTILDLSENLELTKKYRDYGQFLIIAKDQN